jgi:hypothetical protein
VFAPSRRGALPWCRVDPCESRRDADDVGANARREEAEDEGGYHSRREYAHCGADRFGIW